ncbi:hypothetical protein [Motilimonas cestriensis]|uniref:hypothetical protein n=1 Tax=Motilimonas cestriensis TaxID=2742685 RepID=UPI003DA3EA42
MKQIFFREFNELCLDKLMNAPASKKGVDFEFVGLKKEYNLSQSKDKAPVEIINEIFSMVGIDNSQAKMKHEMLLECVIDLSSEALDSSTQAIVLYAVVSIIKITGSHYYSSEE